MEYVITLKYGIHFFASEYTEGFERFSSHQAIRGYDCGTSSVLKENDQSGPTRLCYAEFENSIELLNTEVESLDDMHLELTQVMGNYHFLEERSKRLLLPFIGKIITN